MFTHFDFIWVYLTNLIYARIAQGPESSTKAPITYFYYFNSKNRQYSILSNIGYSYYRLTTVSVTNPVNNPVYNSVYIYYQSRQLPIFPYIFSNRHSIYTTYISQARTYFSRAQRTITQQRIRLRPVNIKQLKCLKLWVKGEIVSDQRREE